MDVNIPALTFGLLALAGFAGGKLLDRSIKKDSEKEYEKRCKQFAAAIAGEDDDLEVGL